MVASEPNYHTQCWFDAWKCWKHVTHTRREETESAKKNGRSKEDNWQIQSSPIPFSIELNSIQFSSIQFCWLEYSSSVKSCQNAPKHCMITALSFIFLLVVQNSYIGYGWNRRFRLLNELILSIHWIKGIRKFSSRHIVVRCHHRFVIANQLCTFEKKTSKMSSSRRDKSRWIQYSWCRNKTLNKYAIVVKQTPFLSH